MFPVRYGGYKYDVGISKNPGGRAWSWRSETSGHFPPMGRRYDQLMNNVKETSVRSCHGPASVVRCVLLKWRHVLCEALQVHRTVRKMELVSMRKTEQTNLDQWWEMCIIGTEGPVEGSGSVKTITANAEKHSNPYNLAAFISTVVI